MTVQQLASELNAFCEQGLAQARVCIVAELDDYDLKPNAAQHTHFSSDNSDVVEFFAEE